MRTRANDGDEDEIVDGSGTSGIDPAYTTLANNEITHLKPMTATSLLAESVGSGSAGIACFGNLTVGIGGLGTRYAHTGMQTTTATVTCIATIDALTVNQYITCRCSMSVAGVINITFGPYNF